MLHHGPVDAILGAALRQGCDWLLPLPADCRLSLRAGQVLRRALTTAKAGVVYWDHDYLTAGSRHDPVLKPDWDQLLHASIDLLRGAALVRCDAAVAALTAEPDLTLRELPGAVAKRGAGVRHLPLLLSHHAGPAPRLQSPAIGAAAQPCPGVSILIPTRDRADLLAMCVSGLEKLDYAGPLEIVVLDNDSREPEALAFLAALQASGRARVVPCPGPFNFAAIINRGADQATHDMLCLLNNDIEPLDGAWLGQMVRHAVMPQCGAVGARLLYPDGTVQHVGVAIGIGDAAGHIAKGVRPTTRGHRIWHSATRRVSAVTGACLVVERSRFCAVGGMDADTFAVDFNDVDLCLRLQAAGFENRVVMEATLVHHESKSRGTVRIGAALVRFERELAALRARWSTAGYRDPWLSPLFRSESQECLLRF